MRHILGAAAATAALVTGAPAGAATLTIFNANFELGPAAGLDGGYVAGHVQGIPGWGDSSGSGTGHWNPTGAHFADEAAAGSVGYAQSLLQTTRSPGLLAQTLADYVVQPNTRYTLTLDVGRYFGHANFGYDFGLIAGFDNGGAILARRTGGADFGEGGFQPLTLTFETGAEGPAIGRTLTIALGGNNVIQGGAAYDNIRLEAESMVAGVVPEPATWAMMILGFGGTGVVIRRRRAAVATA